jgi:hypothetical protein
VPASMRISTSSPKPHASMTERGKRTPSELPMATSLDFMGLSCQLKAQSCSEVGVCGYAQIPPTSRITLASRRPDEF